jgi:hypothetical protein
MSPDAVKDTYRRMITDLGEPILVRRYTGQGSNRPRFDAQVRARVTGYGPDELIGSIVQGDRKIIILVDDLIDRQFSIPIRASDKVVVRGKELSIIAPDDSSRRCGTVLIAYELTGRG